MHVEANLVCVAFGRRDEVGTPAEQLDCALGLPCLRYRLLHLLRHCVLPLLCSVADKRNIRSWQNICQ